MILPRTRPLNVPRQENWNSQNTQSKSLPILVYSVSGSPDTDNSGQPSPITTLRELETLISEAEHLPTSPATPDLKFLRDFSSMTNKNPAQDDIAYTEYDNERPGPSGLPIQKRLVDYSDSDRSSGAEIMSDFIHRPKPPKLFRIYSSTDSKTDMENVERRR
ncbi:hypothetical protein O0L34_g347 [Tuta absoluta]|nr:hypothetical protein O0L34_g347 [Tuta absoluta]